ncbi:MAG TPA: ribonuclease HII [Bacteriovoracaceae bacterium]|nr:ribonuclease HII [Bacteriovoracaceae bacterium]
MIELKLIKEFPCEILAVDEVGRGPLSGPVVISAVKVWIEDEACLRNLLKFLRPKGVKDSKKLTTEERLKVLKKLGVVLLPYKESGVLDFKGTRVSFITWDMCHQTIDEENILAASLRGMREAATFLSIGKKNQTTILIDGHLKLRWGRKKSPWTEIPLIKGDTKSLLIGLASIIAKEKRDAFMREMHELYPQYGFDHNYGYPTREHKKALRAFGPCPIHRKTFKGVKECLGVVPGDQDFAQLPSGRGTVAAFEPAASV